MCTEIPAVRSRRRGLFTATPARDSLERGGLPSGPTTYDDRAVNVPLLEQRLRQFVEFLPASTRATFGLTNERPSIASAATRPGLVGGTRRAL